MLRSLMRIKLTPIWMYFLVYVNLSDGIQWTVKPSPETLGLLGSSVNITWHYRCTGNQSVGFSKLFYNDTKIAIRYRNDKSYTSTNIDTHFSFIGGWNVTILISSVDVKKGEIYCCYVECEDSQEEKSCTKLTIYSLPRITYYTSNVSAKQNDVVKLHCNASGYPAPHLKWINKRTHKMIANSSVTSFRINSKDSEGQYCCQVLNKFGNDTKCTSIRVTEYQPTNTVLTTSKNYILQKNTLQVFCKTDAFPRAKYIIEVVGERKLDNSTHGNVTISTNDNGKELNVSCIAKNKYGEGKAAYLVIPIYEQPAIINHSKVIITMTTNDTTLHCNATGIPRPVITWYNEETGYYNESISGTLPISEASCENKTLHYYCIASNIVGNTNSSLITVKVIRYCNNDIVVNNNDLDDDEIPPKTSHELVIMIVAIVCGLFIVVLVPVCILISQKRKHAKRHTNKERQRSHQTQMELVEESPYGDPIDAIEVKNVNYAPASDADYATVEETGYKRGAASLNLPNGGRVHATKRNHKMEPVYAKVKKKNIKKDKQADIPMNPLYDEIPGITANTASKPPSTPLLIPPELEKPTITENIPEEDGLDNAKETWFSWVY